MLVTAPDALNTAFAETDTVAMLLISALPEYSTPPNAVTVDNPLIAPVDVLTLIESAETVAELVIAPDAPNTLAPLQLTTAEPVIAPTPL